MSVKNWVRLRWIRGRRDGELDLPGFVNFYAREREIDWLREEEVRFGWREREAFKKLLWKKEEVCCKRLVLGGILITKPSKGNYFSKFGP